VAVNDTVMKIFRPAPRVAVAMAGQADIGNSLMQHITTALLPSPAANIDQATESIRTVGNNLFAQWFGPPTWLLGANGPVPTPRPEVWYLSAGYAQNGDPKIISQGSSLHFNFAPNISTTGFAAIGIVPLTIYLLNRLYRRSLALDIAKDLAAYCILETASQDGKVGGPMRMAIVRPNTETEIVADGELSDLAQRVDQHRDALRNSFLTLGRSQSVQPAAAAAGLAAAPQVAAAPK
jgi:hypothetical protein